MTWTSFFKSRAFKYGFFSGGLGFAAGAGSSAAIALKMASLCSTAVNSFISHVGNNIIIDNVNVTVHFEEYSANLTLDDITAALPEGWSDILKQANNLPSYCFSAPFTIGLCITAAASLALASSVTAAIHIHDEGSARTAHHQLKAISDGSTLDEEPLLVL